MPAKTIFLHASEEFFIFSPKQLCLLNVFNFLKIISTACRNGESSLHKNFFASRSLSVTKNNFDSLIFFRAFFYPVLSAQGNFQYDCQLFHRYKNLILLFPTHFLHTTSHYRNFYLALALKFLNFFSLCKVY